MGGIVGLLCFPGRQFSGLANSSVALELVQEERWLTNSLGSAQWLLRSSGRPCGFGVFGFWVISSE